MKTRTDPLEPNRPVFSVLMSSFDQAHFIPEALGSVLEQTFRDWELIVVDDGSSDGSPRLVRAWMDRAQGRAPNRMLLLSQSNQGQSSALENGFRECRGHYIALIDSDDRWLPHKLEEVYATSLAHPDAGMVTHPLWVIDPTGRRTGGVRPRMASLSRGDLREQMLATARHVAPPTSGVTIRADVFDALVPMPTHGFKSAADAYLTFGASLEAPVAAIPEPLSEYRLHPEGHFLRRMSTVSGLQQQLLLQRTIADHFGLKSALEKNSFFMRNSFGHAKLAGSARDQLRCWANLLASIRHDPEFTVAQKLPMALLWTGSLPLPRPLFRHVWGWVQSRQTGQDKVRSAE